MSEFVNFVVGGAKWLLHEAASGIKWVADGIAAGWEQFSGGAEVAIADAARSCRRAWKFAKHYMILFRIRFSFLKHRLIFRFKRFFGIKSETTPRPAQRGLTMLEVARFRNMTELWVKGKGNDGYAIGYVHRHTKQRRVVKFLKDDPWIKRGLLKEIEAAQRNAAVGS